MNSVKLLISTLLLSVFLSGFSQNTIEPAEGYSTQIGIMVDMLEEMKSRIEEEVKDLNQTETDYLIDEKANSIGQLIMHLAANESYYRVETLEERSWTDEEAKFWSVGGGLGDDTRSQLVGKPITYYLELWDEVRAKSLDGLKQTDDDWFASEIEEGINYHWIWFHVLEHSAQHLGQIALIKNKLDD